METVNWRWIICHRSIASFWVSLIALILSAQVCAAHDPSAGGIERSESVREVVKLSKRSRKSIGLRVSEVKKKSLPAEIATLGEIEVMPTRTFIQHALLAGRVCEVKVEMGDRVVAGQVLAVLDSPEVNRLAAETINSKTSIEAEIDRLSSQYQSDREKAVAHLGLAQSNYERMSTLYKEKITSKKNRDTAKAELLVAESHLKNLKTKEKVELKALGTKLNVTVRSLTDRLKQIGVSEATIAKMLKTNTTILKVPIRSSRTGVITGIQANPGETINDQDPLFDVLDLSTIWATADVYETDMNRVAVGQPVVVRAAALPKKIFKGRLSFIGSKVDKKKRTLPVKVEIHNTRLELKPEMYVDMYIQTSEPAPSIILPREAVVERTGHFSIFVEVKPGVYRLTTVKLGRSLGDDVEILSGVKEGERVVTRGAFQVDAHLLKTSGATDLFSHPTESHDHGHGEHSHEGEKKGGFNPLMIIVFALAFVLGCVVTAIMIRSRSIGAESPDEINEAFDDSPRDQSKSS